MPGNDQAGDMLAAELAAGERIVWTGRPDPRTSLASQWYAGLFAAFWLAISGTGFVQAVRSGGTIAAAVTLAFVAIGLIILAQPLVALVRAGSTAYAITDRRLIVARRSGKSVTSVLLDGVRQVERIRKRRGITIRIPTALVSDGDGGQKVDYLELHGLPDGERAYQLLLSPRSRDRDGAESGYTADRF